jgi:uncharacterized repeat protein (TIGR01451 family)
MQIIQWPSRCRPAAVLSISLISMVVALLGASPARAALILEAEVNPDPVQPNQMMDSQITVSNTDVSTTGALTLRVLWPGELNTSPTVTGGGTCSGACDPGDYLSWDLGVLEPASSMTVSFNETVRIGTVDETLIPLEIDLLENAVIVESRALSIEVDTDSPLEIAVDPLSDPVASGATLVYEIVYGNAGAASAENTELSFPIPAGTQFQSATGGGAHDSGVVSWNLGNLAPNSGGRERVTVQVDALDDGTLLLVDAATLSGDVNFFFKQGRAMAVSRVATGPLELDLEVNPDPVQPNQLLDSQITVSNPDVSATGTLTLRVLWPGELNTTPTVTGGGTCSGACSPGRYLSWDLGELGPTSSMTVSFNETVRNVTVDGTLIPLEIELLEGGLPMRNISHTVITQTDSPLEIAVDPLSDPVASGATLVYEIVYGNAGAASAENAELSFPIPAGTQFQSATGGGAHDSGVVSWNLGSLAPNSGGRERVTVQVDALDDGTLLLVDAAMLSGVVNFLPTQSQAMAVSRVATGPLELDFEVNPDPVQPNQLLDSQITVSNPDLSITGTLTLRVLWPRELNTTPTVTGGGTCSGACSPGRHLSWDLGVLGPAASMTVSFNETVRGITPDGTLIPLEIELLEGGLPMRNISHTVITQTDSPLELTVDPLTDPVISGATLVYEIDYGNAGAASAENAELSFPIPAGTQFQSATGGGAHDSGVVSWNLGNLASNSGGRERVTVQVDALDDGTLLLVDAATLLGVVNFLPKQSQAMAVSRVATGPLELAMEVDPNPVTANQDINAEITVNNPTGNITGTLILRVLWPGELNTTPTVTDGGSCSGACNAGRYLSWDLGVLGPSASKTVSFNETVRGSTADGTLIPLEVELLEGGLPARSIFQTVLVNPFTDVIKKIVCGSD